jgi:hypothetical protein
MHAHIHVDVHMAYMDVVLYETRHESSKIANIRRVRVRVVQNLSNHVNRSKDLILTNGTICT